MMIWITTGVVSAFASMVALQLWLRATRKRRIAAQRRVEQPNSHYSPPAVVKQVERERWTELAQADLHPLNREELERLGRLHGRDSHPLPPRARQFVDNLARAHSIKPLEQ